MDYDFEDNSIIILNDSIKLDFIKQLKKNLFKNIKVIGLNEFQKMFYFDYTKETILYVHEKYHCIRDIAEMYIKSLYYVRPIKEEKVQFLLELKKDLEEKNLLEKDEMFKNSLKDKTIYIYNLNYLDKYYDMMFGELESLAHVEYILEDEKTHSLTPLYAFKNNSLELEFVCSSIINLIESGVDINKIKLANVQESYIPAMRRQFADFHIPLEFPNKETIASSNLVKAFNELWQDDLNEAIEQLKSSIKTKREKCIFKSIINVINDYSSLDDLNSLKEIICEDINKEVIPPLTLKSAVKCIDFINYDIKDDEYVFLINFNQGVFPTLSHDEDFLNDNIKEKLGISTSIDLNKKIITKVREKISRAKNLVVSYSKSDISGELYISSAYDKNIFVDKEYQREFTHSNAYNLKELIKEKDETRKYGSISTTYSLLVNHYPDAPYMTYDNKFKGVEKKDVLNSLNNVLTLSYSKMNTFYQCSFRYYLDNILNLNTNIDTFEITVGNIFHKVLSVAFLDNFDFDQEWDNALKTVSITFGFKENFFLKILKEELKMIIDYIDESMSYTSLKGALYEQKITIPIGDDGNTFFKGFVDKILYGNIDGRDIAIIIDYKTGTPELKLSNVLYGLNMQLPIYAYLISKYEPLKDATLGGFYLQEILSNKRSLESKREALKLQGYTNSDESIIKYVDSSYENSKIIKSLKKGPNGFYAYAKVLSNSEIKDLQDLVHEKILAASKDIKDAKFDINPKEIDGKNVGCKYCKYKSICYMKQEDIVKINTKEECLEVNNS